MTASESRDDSYEIESNSPFYFNTSHWRAVDGMLEGVRERAGLMLLTGPTGSGKTMIMRAISEGLEENTPGLFLQYASLNFREFVNFLHSSLRVEDEIMDAPNKAVALREFLYVQAKRNETGVVFIDEAHNLEPDVLKMLPKLARFDTLEDGRVVGLQFILIASEDLREIMADPEYDEVRGKVEIDHTLRFFTRGELKQFLKKRLAPIARMTDVPITDDGVEAMGRFTGGSPRLLGMICSHTMLFAAENPGQSIDAKMVQEAAEALMLSPVENAFAQEDSDRVAVSGPFSEADLSGEETAPKPALPFANTAETVYASDEDETVDSTLRSTDTAPAIDRDAADRDASLYADDHAVMAPPPVEGVQKDDDEANDDMMDGEGEFDNAALDRMVRDDDDDDDLDEYDDLDDLDDLDSDDESDTASKPSVLKGGTAFLNRLGWRQPTGQARPEKVRGASRKKEAIPSVPVGDAKRRGPKTRVKGEREAKLKKAGIAGAAVGVLGLGYLAAGPVVSAVTGLLSKSQQTAAVSSPAMPGSGQGGLNDFVASTTPDIPRPADTVTVNVENKDTGKTGGWGARVVVQVDESARPEGDVARGPALPDAATGIAKGALDLVDKALGAGESAVSNDKVGGLLAVASNKVAGLRNRLSNDGLTDEQRAEKASTLIAEGDAHYAERRYIAPKGGNAYDAYREALSLQPENELAQAGIANLREHFAGKAEGARDARQWESANSFFETAIAISNLRAIN